MNWISFYWLEIAGWPNMQLIELLLAFAGAYAWGYHRGSIKGISLAK